MAQGPEELLLVLFTIFVSAKVMGEVFERLHMPAVLGEILTGVGLGPYALGWIAPSGLIQSLADIGAIFVLFSAGLETSPKDLIRVGRQSLSVAGGGVVVPFLLGFTYMRLHGDRTSEAVFVGAAMVATSVGITVRVLGGLRVLAGRTAKIILGAAVFDDILGMLLLAVVAGVAAGTSFQWLHFGLLLTEAAGFAVFMIFLAPGIVDRIQPGVERLQNENAPLVLALAICLLLSWLALKIGMAAIIGAFFAGLIFADSAASWRLIPRVSGITEFLAPYFFFAIGARFNVHLFNREVLMAALVITLLAIVSKVVGCGLPLFREGWPTVMRVGVGMMPRGEVALIVALVGLQSKIISQANYAIVIFMTGITTLLAPPLLRVLFKGEEKEESNASRPLAPVQL